MHAAQGEGTLEAVEQIGHVIGVNLTDSCVTAAVVDANGQIASRAQERKIDRKLTPQDVLTGTVVPAIEEARRRSGLSIRAIGVSLPGTLRPEEGLCLLSPPLGWEDVPLREILQRATGLPTVIVNDVRAMVRGELSLGAARDIDNAVCISLGTTIQGGLVINGEFYEGGSDSAGEVGHITVDHDGPSCTCGNQGCLETLASGPAVARMASESLKLGAQSILNEWVSEPHPITAEMVHRAARDGDALAIKIWEKVGRYLGLGLASVITIVNPQRIILGGKVAQAFEYFGPTMKEEVRRRARMVPRDYTQLVPSPLGLDVHLLGAAVMALEYLTLHSKAAGAA